MLLAVPSPQEFSSFDMNNEKVQFGVISCAFSSENFRIFSVKMVHVGAFSGVI